LLSTVYWNYFPSHQGRGARRFEIYGPLIKK
jgi:hypothetical protein